MDFQKKVSHYLGKNAARRWKDVISDITAVIGGIKPSFLYDYSSCNSKSLDELAAEMESVCICLTDRPAMHMERAEHSSSVNIDNFRVEKRKSGETRTTGVVSIQDDVFVINRQILRNMLEKFVSKHNETIDGNAIARSEQLHDEWVCAFIDVSGKLPNPSWAARKVDEQMVVIASDILRQIEAGSMIMSGVGQNLTIQDDWNISTVFGLLLGYPVSYWYQLENHDNCLAHIPLHVIKCKCDCVLRSAGADDSMNVSRSSIIFGNKSHVIYSFSIPASLLENASDHVSRWKQYVYHAVDMCEYFNSVSFESSTVTLSAVAL